MYINEVRDLMVKMVKKETPVSLMMWGSTGIGKTSIVDQVGDITGYKVLNIRLSQREAVDILGVPYTGTVRIGDKEVHVSNHHPPKWFMEALMEGNVILFLDELNRAHRDVLQAAFELVLERRINGIVLPDTVRIISACNPPNKLYDTFSFDLALVARFCHVQVVPSVNSWKEWARTSSKKKHRQGKNNINDHVFNFISKHENALNDIDDEDKKFPLTDKQLRPHSRSWEFVSELEDLELEERILEECVRGIVGPQWAKLYIQSRTVTEFPFTVEEVLMLDLKNQKDPLTKRFYFQLGEMDEKGNILPAGSAKKIRVDLFNRTCDDIKKKEAELRANPAHVEKVMDFMEAIPATTAYAMLSEIYDQEDDVDEVWSKAIDARPALMKRFEEMSLAQTSTTLNKNI